MKFEIKSGQLPPMRKSITRATATKYPELFDAIRRMPDGSHLVATDMKFPNARKAGGIKSAITRYCKKHGIVGVACGFTEKDGALVVIKAADPDAAPPPRHLELGQPRQAA